MLRNGVQFHDRRRVERGNGVQAGNRRQGWACADIQEENISLQLRTVHLDRLRTDKPRFALNPIQTRSTPDTSLAAGAEARDDVAFALSHFRHVNAYWA